MAKEEQEQINAAEIPSDGLPGGREGGKYMYRTYNKGLRDASPSAMMIYEDGAIFRYSDQVFSFVDGQMKTEDVPLEWREEAMLKEEAVEAIKNLLDEFDADEKLSVKPRNLTEISFSLGDDLHVVMLEGENTPKNYMIYTKIGKEISLGVEAR